MLILDYGKGKATPMHTLTTNKCQCTQHMLLDRSAKVIRAAIESYYQLEQHPSTPTRCHAHQNSASAHTGHTESALTTCLPADQVAL